MTPQQNTQRPLRPIEPSRNSVASEAPQTSVKNGTQTQELLLYILETIGVKSKASTTGMQTRTFGSTSNAALLDLILELIARCNISSPRNYDRQASERPHPEVVEYIHWVVKTHEFPLRTHITLGPPGPLVMIPLDIRSLMLERYIATGWKILPLQSPTSLRARLANLANHQPQQPDKDAALRCLLFHMLGIGSILTMYAEVGKSFIEEAQSNIITRQYAGDLLDLQIDLLMISIPPRNPIWTDK